MGSAVKYKTHDGGREVTRYDQIDFVPADPALRGLRWEDGQVVDIGPLVCWRISTTFEPDGEEWTTTCPITHDGAVGGTHVLYPDGTVRFFDETYKDVDEWIEYEISWEILKAKDKAFREAQRKASGEAESPE
jgi:hypothetical protein